MLFTILIVLIVLGAFGYLGHGRVYGVAGDPRAFGGIDIVTLLIVLLLLSALFFHPWGPVW